MVYMHSFYGMSLQRPNTHAIFKYALCIAMYTKREYEFLECLWTELEAFLVRAH